MQIPPSLLSELKNIPGFDHDAFISLHDSGVQVTSIRINPRKPAIVFPSFPLPLKEVPWTKFGFYLSSRPSFTFDPLFHAGCYYVQEASSMFIEQALQQTVDLSAPLKVLDLCAAPGGKSTHIQSLIAANSMLVSNEIIRGRSNILKDNIIKWGTNNVIVTNNDPADFAKLPGYFDVIVVDAPCSGSGLFRKDEDAINEWSEQHVHACAMRQQRILADVWPALKDEGILVYSTCSYSREEDESICEWLENDLDANNIALEVPANWNIIQSDKGYRFWPNQVDGEGFFLAVFRKKAEVQEGYVSGKPKVTFASRNEREIIESWTDISETDYIKHEETVYAWPVHCAADFGMILQKLRVVYSGTRVGELVRDKLVPDHALALSTQTRQTIPRVAVGFEMAIRYLQRKDVQLPQQNKGWHIVTYEGAELGWVNILPNRVNNYYPKELRILKDI